MTSNYNYKLVSNDIEDQQFKPKLRNKKCVLSTMFVTVFITLIFIFIVIIATINVKHRPIELKKQLMMRGCVLNITSKFEMLNCIQNLLAINKTMIRYNKIVYDFVDMKYDNAAVQRLMYMIENILANTREDTNILSSEFNVNSYFDNTAEWSKNQVLYWCYKYYDNKYVSRNTMHNIIRNATNQWSSVTNLKFVEGDHENILSCNIIISVDSFYHKYINKQCSFGTHNTLAHAVIDYYRNSKYGFIHVYNEQIKRDYNSNVMTMTHEIGHILGLRHSNSNDDVMSPYFNYVYSLTENDIHRIRKLYGYKAINQTTTTPKPTTTQKPTTTTTTTKTTTKPTTKTITKTTTKPTTTTTTTTTTKTTTKPTTTTTTTTQKPTTTSVKTVKNKIHIIPNNPNWSLDKYNRYVCMKQNDIFKWHIARQQIIYRNYNYWNQFYNNMQLTFYPANYEYRMSFPSISESYVRFSKLDCEHISYINNNEYAICK